MTPEEYDIKGRAVVQNFYDELEKIAYSGKTRALFAAANKAKGNVGDAAKTLGASRFVPFTQAHKAYYGHVGKKGSGVVGRASHLANEAEGLATKERSAMLKALQSGKGNQKDILKRLKEGPQNVGAIASPVRKAVRAVGGSADVEDIAPKKGMTPAVRSAALAGTGIATGAAGLYAGQKYLDQKKTQQGGYGGY